ncbi:MAG: hypothetical protein J6B20_01535 [Clostridia bacterium]|nr:hypothetical protein [Clostridia bacterium]
MGLKDLFRKIPTKEKATLGAKFSGNSTAEEIFDYLQKAKAEGKNIYVVYEYEWDVGTHSGLGETKFYSIDDNTLDSISETIFRDHHRGMNEEQWDEHNWYPNNEANSYARCDKNGTFEDENLRKLFEQDKTFENTPYQYQDKTTDSAEIETQMNEEQIVNDHSKEKQEVTEPFIVLTENSNGVIGLEYNLKLSLDTIRKISETEDRLGLNFSDKQMFYTIAYKHKFSVNDVLAVLSKCRNKQDLSAEFDKLVVDEIEMEVKQSNDNQKPANETLNMENGKYDNDKSSDFDKPYFGDGNYFCKVSNGLQPNFSNDQEIRLYKILQEKLGMNEDDHVQLCNLASTHGLAVWNVLSAMDRSATKDEFQARLRQEVAELSEVNERLGLKFDGEGLVDIKRNPSLEAALKEQEQRQKQALQNNTKENGGGMTI